ncbi:GNAT family N-acetyltransferase [Devosia albogilva]|uniref:GNAT family N-acetyltransferase n=1 Tax=Devosia albogilva TaxID=429726 RepID=A0ABW5QJE6_9HYPH
MTELGTPRLLLRPANSADAPAFTLAVGEFAVARHLTALPWPYTLAMAIDWLRQAPAVTPERAMFIIEHADHGLVGCITLADELGFWVARRFWNRGYATEAASAVLDWRFAASPEPVIASAQRNNHASLAVQRKLGFVAVGEEMRYSHALQCNVRHVVSRLDASAWLERGRAA